MQHLTTFATMAFGDERQSDPAWCCLFYCSTLAHHFSLCRSRCQPSSALEDGLTSPLSGHITELDKFVHLACSLRGLSKLAKELTVFLGSSRSPLD